ncbi:MAG TPA: hypothetical protein VGZ00_08760 [Candidatus Baltobacteraceae bacterium]|nr:hypothetical protein [Candidatus Baltobacteraceae bacterium]
MAELSANDGSKVDDATFATAFGARRLTIDQLRIVQAEEQSIFDFLDRCKGGVDGNATALDLKIAALLAAQIAFESLVLDPDKFDPSNMPMILLVPVSVATLATLVLGRKRSALDPDEVAKDLRERPLVARRKYAAVLADEIAEGETRNARRNRAFMALAFATVVLIAGIYLWDLWYHGRDHVHVQAPSTNHISGGGPAGRPEPRQPGVAP